MKQCWIILAVVGFAAGLCRPAFSEDQPMDYFNKGSAHFIKGQRDEALAKVNAGLSLYPDDYYLQALKKAIEEDKQQEQQQKKNQDQQKKDQEKKDQEQQQKDQDQEKQDKQKQKQEQQQDQKDGQEEKQDQEQQAQPVKAEDMTKEEAMQLLDALKQQEQADREKIRVSVGGPVPVEKDW